MESLPEYAAVDPDHFATRIAATETIELPLLRAPSVSRPMRMARDVGALDNPDAELVALQFEIIEAFFAAIEARHDDVVAAFISRGLVSPDVTSTSGETPLLAAVRSDSLPTISTLVAHGATVDMLGNAGSSPQAHPRPWHQEEEESTPEMRTPLQLAASNGQLAIVKVLMKDYGADDSIMAPDGSLALRLAAANGHREVVDYLPVRRGGAWLRWQTAHRREMVIVRSVLDGLRKIALIIVWRVPRFLLYRAPKELCTKVWRNRYRAAKWVKQQAQAIPRRIKKCIVNAPRYLEQLAKEIVDVCKRLAKRLWLTIKAIPGVVKSCLLWIGNVGKQCGEFIVHLMNRILSALHTAFSAVVSFFKSITLQDVLDGLSYVARAIFIEGPKMLAGFCKSFWEKSYKAFAALFGCLGKVFWWIFVEAIPAILLFVPKQLWKCVTAIGRSMRQGYREAMAHYNPKHM